jgi:hypothetical protein
LIVLVYNVRIIKVVKTQIPTRVFGVPMVAYMEINSRID